MKSIRYIFMSIWVAGFAWLTHRARQTGETGKLVDFLQQGYYGYDPFVKRGIITGLIYATLDGYITGLVFEFLIRRRFRGNEPA